uniref:Reverse transcriptase domain-containing protein n=1 Tax=Lactuca sativa TaxID=4236 RepID=A0A9R1V3J5_LACSA|nr:hypothetical protein LSAT_V11C600333980 [Lactuca sativa]
MRLLIGIKRKEKMMILKKWNGWINACPMSSRDTIVVNACPTHEFSLYKGLRQGDMVSNFLFIIVMKERFSLSQLFYAYDALFMEQRDHQNITKLVSILNYFYMVSGIRLNLQKSNLYGIGVNDAQVEVMVMGTWCLATSFPFHYHAL